MSRIEWFKCNGRTGFIVSTPDDRLKLAVGGDANALASLLEEFGPQVRARMQGQIDRRWQSMLSDDDIMQESYAEAFLSIRRFEVRGSDWQASFISWLTRIARNNLLDAVKALKSAKAGGAHRRVDNNDPNSSYMNLCDNLGYTTTTPSRIAAGDEAREVILRNIKALPESYRDVVQHYDLRGRSAEETAAAMGCSVGAMYMRRARAFDLLRGLLQIPLP